MFYKPPLIQKLFFEAYAGRQGGNPAVGNLKLAAVCPYSILTDLETNEKTSGVSRSYRAFRFEN